MKIKTKLPWTRKLFIDCGGHNGSSVRKFRRQFDPTCRFEIFTFEPNPAFARDYANFQRHHLLPYAVWTDDTEMDFFLDREDGDGSTLIREKTTREDGGIGQLDKEIPLKVRAIDLSSWIKRNFRNGDHLVLKLDIEGAEYKVLEKLIQDETIKLVDQLFIEWHWSKIGLAEAAHRDLASRLATLGIPVTEWDAQRF